MADYLTTSQGRRLAYRYSTPKTGLTYVWLSGFKSDMSGTKVTVLEDWAREAGHGFLAFDYSGHGLSDGAFTDGTISAWREDALSAISELTEGPLVLVGSSMGGWIALLAALALVDRVKGLVLIAPAPDFTEKLMWPTFSAEQQAEIMEDGLTLRPSDYDEPYAITRDLILDGAKWSLLDGAIAFAGPVRILQGVKDEDVPWQHAHRIVDQIVSEDVVFTLVKDGDHRLSREQDIARLIETCAGLSQRVEG
ncbi:MAG: alpha/beta hydrolase [Pseudomonadota bacterium]